MSSKALNEWHVQRFHELDEIEQAHRTVGGSGRGRRFATEQLNNAYLLLLCAQFQGFCRDLHSECIDQLLYEVTPPKLQRVLREVCVSDRKLDKGNPNRENLDRDFSRLGFDIRSIFDPESSEKIAKLNGWRNAIAHQDFDPGKFAGRTKLRLAEVRNFRRLCNRLAVMFDENALSHIKAITGQQTWR